MGKSMRNGVTINTNPYAFTGDMAGERTIAFSGPPGYGGGLISFQVTKTPDGGKRLLVQFYRCDETVVVTGPAAGPRS